MSSAGEDRPPEGPDRPGDAEYTVYGRGGESRKRKPPQKQRDPGDPSERGEAGAPGGGGPAPGGDAGEAGAGAGAGDGGTAEKPKPDRGDERPERPSKPEYSVYRSRPGLRDRLRKPDLAGLRRERRGGRGSGGGGGLRSFLSGGGKRRWLRWVLVAAVGWLLISFLAFAISAQIQKGKLQDSAKNALKGGPVLTGSNILILGGDRRGPSQKHANGTEGAGPPRADTIMVVHAGLGSFRKLSIPRDSYAAIPDCGSQKINASFACNTQSAKGNPASTIRTVEDFLGIDINHIIIVDFKGFADFIDAIGGVTVDIPDNKNVSSVCELKKRTLVVRGHIDGGKAAGGVDIGLTAGKHTLAGEKALALARLRHNICDPSENDLDRAARQQLILNGIKGRLTSPLRFPINFIKGPIIGWTAPKAFISDMGGINLPQLALTSLFGGGGANVLKPSLDGPAGSILIPHSQCVKAVKKLLGSDPPHDPACSPGT